MNVRIYQLAMRTFTAEGTLKSAEKMLPYIASMGFTHVQLTPVSLADDGTDRTFWSRRQIASGTENPANNYRMKDYFHVDPEYGTDGDFRDFVKSAHRAGLKVMADLVYFHCGPNAVFLKEHPDFVRHNPDGSVNCGEWHFPVLNFHCEGLREYLWENMELYIRDFDVDGFRCDVGDYVPLDFWREGFRRCRMLKQDLFLLNEGRNQEYLGVFDCNYFSPVAFSVPQVVKGEMSAEEFRAGWEAWRKTLPREGRMLHFLDNHDVASDSGEDRLEKTLGHDAMDALHVLDYTLDGVPFVFCGNELADSLKHNMFANRFHGKDAPVQWENALCAAGQKRMEIVKRCNRLRDEYPALNTADLVWLEHDQTDHVLAFVRPGEESLLVLISLSPEKLRVRFRGNPGTDNIRCVMNSGTDLFREGESAEAEISGFGYYVGICGAK